MSIPAYAVDYRGHPACPCQAQWLPVLEAEAQRRGILRGTLPISQLIGGAAASGNTHISGGAADFYPLTAILDVLAFVDLAREMGADATFERLENWDGDGGVRHVHSVLRGCEHNGPARYQITAVDAGFNGLGYLGQAAPDAGPRPLSGRTWRQGIEWARQQGELTMDAQATAAFADLNAKIDALGKQVARVNDRSVKRDAALRELVKKRFGATDADLDELFDAVNRD